MENPYNPDPYGWKIPLTMTSAQNTAKSPRPVGLVKPLPRYNPQTPTGVTVVGVCGETSQVLKELQTPKSQGPLLQMPLVSIRQDVLKKAATAVGPESTHMVCCNCSSEIDTVTDIKPGRAAYKSGILLFILGCVCGCCLIPCCMDTCMDVHHKCPECGVHLGQYQRH